MESNILLRSSNEAPEHVFYSVVRTKSNMLKRKLTTTVSEWVTSVTVTQQQQWTRLLLIALLLPRRCDQSAPSAAAVHRRCRCSGWDTSSGNDLPTYETWKGKSSKVRVSFCANIISMCAISLVQFNSEEQRHRDDWYFEKWKKDQ